MKDLIKENFSTYLDEFFEEENESDVLERLFDKGAQSIAVLGSGIADYIASAEKDKIPNSEEFAQDLVVHFVEMATMFGIVKLLKDLSEEKGGDIDGQGTIN